MTKLQLFSLFLVLYIDVAVTWYNLQGTCTTCFKIYRQTKFHPHRTTSGEHMTSYQFSRWQPWWRSTTSGFVSNDVTLSQKPKSICNQISSIYLKQRLRYSYFRFCKTNVCHIGIFLPVIGMSICIRVQNFIQFAPPAAEI